MKAAYLTLMTLLFSVVLWAQEKTTDVDINLNKEGGSNWYASPWVWIVGAAVFILLLVALTSGSRRSSSSSDRVTYSKTVERDPGV